MVFCDVSPGTSMVGWRQRRIIKSGSNLGWNGTLEVTWYHVFTVLKIPKLDILFKMPFHKCWIVGNSHFPCPVGCALTKAGHCFVGFHWCEGTRMADGFFHHGSLVHFCKTLFSPVSSYPVWVYGVIQSQVCDSVFAFPEFTEVSASLSLQTVEVPLDGSPPAHQLFPAAWAGFCTIQVVTRDRNRFTSTPRNFAAPSNVICTTWAPAAFWRATRAHLPHRATA